MCNVVILVYERKSGVFERYMRVPAEGIKDPV